MTITMSTKIFLTLILILSTASIHADADNEALTEQTVGAKAMPAEIASIGDTPFKMKDLKRPMFPDRQVTISQATIGDNGKITKGINMMIAEMSKRGGGRVIVPKGHWMSGRIILKSNVELHLEDGAVI